MKFTKYIFSIAVGSLLIFGSTAHAQYPEKPITTVNGAGVGGGLDTYARVLASAAPIVLNGQPMVVVNKTGAGHVNALKFVKNAKPDGYTIGVISAGSGVLATNLRNVGVKIFDDFEIVAQFGSITAALLVHKDSPYKTPKDIIEAAKKSDSKLRFGHSGRGTSVHVAALAWLKENGIQMQDVPFKGGGQSRAALIAKQVDMISIGIQQLTGFEDKLRAIAVFQGARDGTRKEVPTMKELGMPYIDVFSPVMVFAPKGTPEPVLQKLEDAVKQITQNRAYKKLAKGSGLNTFYRPGKEAKAVLTDLEKKWTPIINELKANKK